jgi:hypothetical protein
VVSWQHPVVRPDEVAKALEGGFLEGREVRELSTDWGVTFAVDIVPPELREAWRELRALVPRLGRWPVAAMAMWDGPFDERSFSRWLYGEGDNSPEAICARARELALEDAVAGPNGRDAQRYDAMFWDKLVEYQLDATRRRVGDAPPTEEVAALDLRPDMFALERWLFDWEEARRPTTAPEPGRHADWFEPPECTLLLLPTALSEEVPAYLSFFGAEGPGGRPRAADRAPAQLARALRGGDGGVLGDDAAAESQRSAGRPRGRLRALRRTVDRRSADAGAARRDHSRPRTNPVEPPRVVPPRSPLGQVTRGSRCETT